MQMFIRYSVLLRATSSFCVPQNKGLLFVSWDKTGVEENRRSSLLASPCLLSTEVLLLYLLITAFSVRGECPACILMQKLVDEVWKRSIGVDRNHLTLGKCGMRAKVLESFSCEGKYCSEDLLVIAEAGQEGCA